MIPPVTSFIFRELKGYVAFLQTQRMNELIDENLRRLHEAKLPMMEFFSHLSPEELRLMTVKDLTDYFAQVQADTAMEASRAGITRWKNDQIPGISREKIQVSDIIKAYSIRRQLLLHFLPEYTTDCTTIVRIMQELEEFYQHLHRYALETYAEIQQAELREKNEFMASLIENSVLGISVYDRQMRILEWNPALEKLNRVKKADVLGKFVYEIFPAYASTEEARAIAQVFEGNKVYLADRPYRSGKGWYDAHAIPLFGKDGEVTGCLSMIQDITFRKESEIRLKEQREELEAANEELIQQREELEAMNEELQENLAQLEEVQETLAESENRMREAQAIAHLGSWEYDVASRTLHFSEEMQQILGYDLTGLAGDADIHFTWAHPQDQELVRRSVIDCLHSFTPYSIEYRTIRPDGSIRWLQAKGQAVLSEENTLFKFRGTCLDITERKEAELKLEAEQYFIRKLTDASPDVITLYDLELGRNLFSSREVYSILGYSEAEMDRIRARGQEAFVDYFHPDDLPVIIAFLESYKTYREEAPRDLEYRIKNAAGEWVHILDRYRVFKRNEAGLPVQIMGVARDVTDRKQTEAALRESRQFIQLVADSVPNIIFVYDLQTQKNVYVNREITTLLGYSAEQIQQMGNRMLDNLIHPDDISLVHERSALILADRELETHEVIYRIRSAGGEWRWLRDVCKLFKRDAQGKPWQILGVTEDITSRKRAEEELRQSNFQLKEANEELMRSEEAVRELADELETRVEQRTTELIQKNEQLQRINADLDNFVYTASHDLRSPIANLEGLLQTLIRRNKDKLAGGDTGVLDMMNDSIIRLNRTIADLTGIARMQKDLDEASNEKVTFAEILSEVQSDIRPLITEADAVIETHLEVPDIHYSRKNLRSILHNLISNALKYHSPDRRAEVKIETQTAGPYVVLCVIDNGLGIPANQQQRIFSLFRRAHTHVEGSGIGLYIVKRIVENSGGRIELESQPGKGSTFKIYLKSLTDTYQSSSAAQLDLTEMDEVE